MNVINRQKCTFYRNLKKDQWQVMQTNWTARKKVQQLIV